MSTDPSAASASWRSDVAQSYRSSEVRSIATVLAELEPGATSASKTMLAMRFEESIFKAASSLDDYKKTIEKRLKKLRKHYSKQQESSGGAAVDNADLTREKERLLENELIETFGARIRYIVEKSDLAVKVMRDKGDTKEDEEKVKILHSHATKVREWASILGLLPNGIKEKKDLAYLTKTKENITRYIDSVRDHVSKICDPEMYITDTFTKLDEHSIRRPPMSDILRKAFQDTDPESSQFDPEELKRLIEKMTAPLPIPRKGDEVTVALAKIERLRTAAAAMYNFWGLSLGQKTEFLGCTTRCIEAGFKCLAELEQEYDSLIKDVDDTDENGERVIQLEDAWNNTMQFTENDTSLDIDEPVAKRQKIEDAKPIVICSRVLFTPGKTVKSSILPVLQRKQATLIQNSTSPHIVLQFGKVFEMKVFFVPLLVTIRAIEEKNEVTMQVGLGGGLRWPSLHQGLNTSSGDDKELSVLGVTGSNAALEHIVAKKLQYASFRATCVLRHCFAETLSGKGALATSDFEVEILEVGALVKFLQIARETYNNNWVDDP